MPEIRRGTTPIIQLDLDQSLIGCWYRVIFEQAYSRHKIIKRDSKCELSEDGKSIRVRLTQEDTYSFDHENNLKVQVRYGVDDLAFATNIIRVPISEILEEDVIE